MEARFGDVRRRVCTHGRDGAKAQNFQSTNIHFAVHPRPNRSPFSPLPCAQVAHAVCRPPVILCRCVLDAVARTALRTASPLLRDPRRLAVSEVACACARARQMPGVDELNDASADSLAGWMLLCCASPLFAVHMSAMRPFKSSAHLLRCAETAWAALPVSEKGAAYSAHARLGERSARPRTVEQWWSADEQAAVRSAEPEVRDALQELGAQYYHKFGFHFLISPTGRSAQALVDALRSRIRHSRRRELRIADAEQRLITRNRLHRLLSMRSERAELEEVREPLL